MGTGNVSPPTRAAQFSLEPCPASPRRTRDRGLPPGPGVSERIWMTLLCRITQGLFETSCKEQSMNQSIAVGCAKGLPALLAKLASP